MVSLLEVPEIRELAFRVPVERYHRIAEGLKTELLRGTIIAKMSKSPFHQVYGDRLNRILFAQISPEFVLRREGPLTLVDSEPEPDIAIVSGPDAPLLGSHPATAELAIEIAVTSLEIDRIKAGIYAEAGVKEYWIVVAEKKLVEVYRNPSGGTYSSKSVVSAPVVLESSALPGVCVDLGALFA